MWPPLVAFEELAEGFAIAPPSPAHEYLIGVFQSTSVQSLAGTMRQSGRLLAHGTECEVAVRR